MGMLTQCYYILEVCNFLFDFTGAHSQEFAWNLRDFEFGLLNNVETVKIQGTLGERLNAFCIIRVHVPLGTRDRIVWLEY
jgi:hypothetical protein